MTDTDKTLSEIIRRMNQLIERGNETIKAIDRTLLEMERQDATDDDHGRDEQRASRGN